MRTNEEEKNVEQNNNKKTRNKKRRKWKRRERYSKRRTWEAPLAMGEQGKGQGNERGGQGLGSWNTRVVKGDLRVPTETTLRALERHLPRADNGSTNTP